MSSGEKKSLVIVRVNNELHEQFDLPSNFDIQVEFRDPSPEEEYDYGEHKLFRKVQILINGLEAPIAVEDTSYFSLRS